MIAAFGRNCQNSPANSDRQFPENGYPESAAQIQEDPRRRLTASSNSFAATIAPSPRIVPATAVARVRISGASAIASAAESDSNVDEAPSCAAPIPSAATWAAQ